MVQFCPVQNSNDDNLIIDLDSHVSKLAKKFIKSTKEPQEMR